MLANALALAIITTAGAYLIYKKIPRRVRRLIEKHALLTDLLSLVLIYIILGGTLTALTAAAIAGVFISIMLHIANHPYDFLYLFDLRDKIKEKLEDAKQTLTIYGKNYVSKTAVVTLVSGLRTLGYT